MHIKSELRNFIEHYGLEETKEVLAELEEEMSDEIIPDIPGFEGTREDLAKIKIR